MVKIAISGATGGVAREVTDALVARQKHDIILLSRKSEPSISGARWVQTDYKNSDTLAQHLKGVHTVLCFITVQSDLNNASQKALIDASVQAGVVRYAPSEWATSTMDHMPWNEPKMEIRDYLRQINKEKNVLEYCLFQPGMFINYLAFPHATTAHVQSFQTHIDFENRRAIVLAGAPNHRVSFITVRDFCRFVAAAVEYEGQWPEIGGIKGDELSPRELIDLGVSIRGPFTTEEVLPDDLKAGVVKTSWLPLFDHPAFTAEQIRAMGESLLAGVVLGMDAGAFSVSDEWNKLLPDITVTTAREFLSEVWEGKP